MIDGVAELARNRWPNSTEMGGRFDPKWVAEFNRNTQFVQPLPNFLDYYRSFLDMLDLRQLVQ
jgi:hypothetical protein